ncbi:hypothetical protein BS50DRAFT_464356, partial [Corynespora cassiicola Philippines]
SLALVVLFAGSVVAGDVISGNRIKVFLFAAPAFFSEVAVDAYNNTCVSLDNNLIDGRVRSILVGGHDVVSVLSRTDGWYCDFFDNYDCSGDDTQRKTFADGVNNLGSSGWGRRIHSIRCTNED